MVAVQTKKVLVVDDDLDVLDTVRSILEMDGYLVDTAIDGVEALKKVAQEMPDVILLDMKMPLMDGPAFAREFRERYGYKTSVIGFTAAADCHGYAQEVWANGWLGKPFSVADLERVVERHAR